MRSPMDIREFPPLRQIDDAIRQARGLRMPRCAPAAKKAKTRAPRQITCQAGAVVAAAVQRARAETHSTPRVVTGNDSSRLDESEEKQHPVLNEVQSMEHNERAGTDIPGPSPSPGARFVLWDCTVPEISPSAITPAPVARPSVCVNPRGEHGIGLLFTGCGGSEGEVPESVTEPSGMGQESCQPANAWRPALNAPSVPVSISSNRSQSSTTESSAWNPPPTDTLL